MTPLGARIAQRIAQSRPISVAAYMAAALSDPEFGYYARRMPLGAEGDFVTAPDISQMFGELIGLWCVDLFEQLGSPEILRVVELGPGRGTLVADLWRVAAIRPEFQNAARLRLVEMNPTLRMLQKTALQGVAAEWHTTFAAAAASDRSAQDGAAQDGAAPLIVIANEFFDALPVHQLVKTGSGWRERMVGFDSAAQAFFFVAAAEPTPIGVEVPPALHDAPPGSIFEIGLEACALMERIAADIAASRGAALVIDYGHGTSAIGDTLQAVRGHRYHDPLADPGLADVTAHVDFAALIRAAEAKGVRCRGPATQGEFLSRLGIAQRAERLSQARPDRAEEISTALARLINGDKMGTLFKVLAVADPSLIPAGFDSDLDG
ncbi:MAG: SAM-dependent methyltransferase [Alphaproteobacteria bacterium]